MRRLYKVRTKNSLKLVPLNDLEVVKVYEHLGTIEENMVRKSIHETITETIFDYDILPKKIKKIVDGTLRLIQGL
jgi:hypothetical protein